ncbi:MAG: acyl-CoA dehydratase activase [Candidatus Cloacimonetes bacterium]|nr:acyl-CoA dehydratase activase [Candidatus Cloacimonadota bacterium]
MIKLGIDVGSRNSKIVLYDTAKGKLIYSAFVGTEVSPKQSVKMLKETALQSLEIDDSNITTFGVTGYGRKLFPEANSILSEITCHAAGCLHFFPTVRTIIDIGGQDAKIISIDTHGKVADFVMNDKCAAGTGRFLEMTALRLGCEIGELSLLATKSTKDYKLTSTCAVFAESEIIGMMASAVLASDIARSVHRSVAKRIVSQMAGLAWEPPVIFTGGVALNKDLGFCLGKELGTTMIIPLDPEITGALGAAILSSIPKQI